VDRQFEVECKVLGAVIWKEYLVAKVGFLNKEDFYFIEHRVIWDKIKRLAENGKPINPATLYREVIKVNTKDWRFLPGEYMASLVDHVAGFSYLKNAVVDYAKEIKYEAINNNSGGKRTPEDILQMADELRKMDSMPGEITSIKDLLTDEINKLQSGEYEQETGYKTGIGKLDECIGGLRSGDMIVLAGRSSVGKTTLALNIACSVAKEYVIPVLFINLEMTGQMIIRKIIAKFANIETDRLNKALTEHEVKKIMLFGGELAEGQMPLMVYDRGSINVTEIEELLKPGNFKFVVIDQLTKVRSSIKRENRFDLEIADKTFAIKEMAKQYKIPIMLVHQINREIEKRSDKRPMLSDLRDSGAIEQDADIVLFVHRDAIYSGNEKDTSACIRIAKNKMGKTKDCMMRFNGGLSEFVEVENDNRSGSLGEKGRGIRTIQGRLDEKRIDII
jgi:replicative DNA helicase